MDIDHYCSIEHEGVVQKVLHCVRAVPQRFCPVLIFSSGEGGCSFHGGVLATNFENAQEASTRENLTRL